MLPIPKFYKSITGIDIAFVDGGTGADTITQVAAQFVIAGFVAGDSIVVSGSTSNDGTYTIVSVVAGVITLATGLLTAEIAGDTVTIDSEATTIYDFGNCDAGSYKPDSTGLIIFLWNDKAIAGSDTMTSVRLSVRDADGNEDDIWTKQCWNEVKSNGGTATVDDAMTAFAKVGLNHELTLGDIQSGKYRILYIRVHAPTDAIEGNITFQLRVKYQDSATDLTGVIEQHLQDVRAADDDYVHAAITGTGAILEVTTAITNPDVGRNTSIKTTNNSSPSGIVIITGINTQGASATDNITIVAGSTVYGNVAFVTISKITIPAGVNAADTVTVGISDKLGLISAIDNVANVFKKKVNAVDESDEISGKVSTTYGTLDCATITDYEDITIWYIGR